MTDLERVARAIQAGCNAADVHHLACSYPDCCCRMLPAAIRAALDAALDAMRQPEAAGFFGDRGG